MADIAVDATGSGSTGSPTANPYSSWGITGNVATGAHIFLAVGGDSDGSFESNISGTGWSLVAEINSGGSGYIFYYNAVGTGANPSISWGQTHDRLGYCWASYTQVDGISWTIMEDTADNAIDGPSHTADVEVRSTHDKWVAAFGYRNITATEPTGWTARAQSEVGWGRQAFIMDRTGTDSDTENPAAAADSGTSPYLAAVTIALHSKRTLTPDDVATAIVIPASFGIGLGERVTATEVDLVAGVPSITVIEKQLILPGSVTVLADIPLPDVGLRPDPVNVPAAIPTPGIGAGTAITVAAVSCVAAVPGVTVLERQTITATTVAAPTDVPAVTPIERITLTAVALDLVGTVHLPPSVTGGQGTAPATVSAPASIPSFPVGGPSLNSKWSLDSELRSEYELSI